MNEGIKYITTSLALMVFAAICAYVDVSYFK